MFTKTGVNEVKNSSGYAVRIIGRYEIKYAEGNHVLLVEMEPGIDLGIYKESIVAWQPPYSEEDISEIKKVEIIANLDAALNFMDIAHRFL